MKYLSNLYNDVFKSAAESMGLHTIIRNTYWKGRYLRHPGVASHDINGITANFQVTNHRECRRLSELMGESRIIADLLAELREDDIVYDIGANIGMYTCFVAQRLPAENVIAFEPYPKNADALEANLSLNDTAAAVVEKALADTSGTTDLAVRSAIAGEGRHALDTGGAEQTIEVPVTTGDDIAGQTEPAPSIVKIDVEGSELRVLEGFAETLSSQACRCCYVEVHPDRLQKFGDSVDAVTDFLTEVGFELTTLYDREAELFIKGKKEV